MPPKSVTMHEWIEESLERHAEGEGAEYDFGLTADEATGAPLYIVFVWIPGAVLGTHSYSGFRMTNPAAIDPMNVDDLVRQTIEACRANRSRQLAEAQSPDGEGPPEG